MPEHITCPTDAVNALDRVWDRLRVLAITLENGALDDESAVATVGKMIVDLLVDDLDPAIEELKKDLNMKGE